VPLYTPPPGFHFLVEVLGLPPDANDIRFVEVGGLGVEIATEDVPEGGENRFVQKYPVRARFGDLTLKRGLMTRSAVWQWIERAVDELLIEPKDVHVSLLNEAHVPLMAWHLEGAWPVKWSISDLNASNNAFVVESLQLSYRRFRRLAG
jgi:phage tail-like protein